MSNANRLNHPSNRTPDELDEVTLGTEDRAFLAEDGWYWQARGSADTYGPFETLEECRADYDAT